MGHAIVSGLHWVNKLENFYIGNFSRGQRTDRLAFNIDNDAFPTLFNYYVWRGRVKRKRGTAFIGQLERQLESVASITEPWEIGPIGTLNGSGAFSGNLITIFTLQSTSSFASGSFTLSDGTNTYTEPASPNGTLIGSPGGSGTINYASGAITITGGAPGGTFAGTFAYYPTLPVMGLRDFIENPGSANFPVTLAFDTLYSYEYNQTASPTFFYDVNYYKETSVPFVWSGADYQQFWTVNYEGALWATNNKSGLNVLNGTYVSGSGTTTVTFNFKTIGGANFTTLVDGDILWFNEWNAGGNANINGVTGEVTDTTGSASGNYVVTFTVAPTVSGTGIVQTLTNTIPGQDGIKWYDGDQTSGTGIPTTSDVGWVNFAPPLTASSVVINNSPPGLYYLAGALAILPYKNFLLFFSPYIQTSQAGAPIQLIDTVLWSQIGTPYYTDLTPENEGFDPKAYYVDQTGHGDYNSSGLDLPIQTVSNNEDALIIGFGGAGAKTRLVYTGNDLSPFLFFSINSELPSNSTFSSVALDRGSIDLGTFGICITDQQSAQRIDLDIPDSVFSIQTDNHGLNRVSGIRDFQNEWMYFTYPVQQSNYVFPTQTFLFNYRDKTWAIFYENWTTHGNFRKSTGYTWATIPFDTWSAWNDPWNWGNLAAFIPTIIAGNPQGYVLQLAVGTNEGQSGSIVSISNSGGFTQINSWNHCLTASNPNTDTGDYIYVQNAIGLTGLNNTVGRVIQVVNNNAFVVDIPFPIGTYLGLGQYAKLSHPFMQTKQFEIAWKDGRQATIGNQKYLLDTTAIGQVTLEYFMSMDSNSVWNNPQTSGATDGLIFSQIVYTCPELQNIGLTPQNVNLQMAVGAGAAQYWHRSSQPMTGDTFQFGITLSDAQMKNITIATSEIVLQAMQGSVSGGPMVA